MEALLVTSKETGIEANAQKTKYMFISCQQNVGQNYNIKDSQKILSKYGKLHVLESGTNKQNCMHINVKWN
jgi:hypothetical protein